jgi:hypothetical protein
MRDLKADLEVCEKATDGTWFGINRGDKATIHFEKDGKIGDICIVDGGCNYENDAIFVIEARGGWPEAIKRAIKAEENCQKQQEYIAELRKNWAEAIIRASEIDQENAQLRNLFEMQRKRCQKATYLWRKETGQKLVTPDLGELIEWLMDKGDFA